MRTIRAIDELRAALRGPRREGRTLGLVPTMGAFHDGHLSLIRRARADCEVVVVSLFVNPAQFGEAADLATYPRDEARDARLAAAEGVDVLFAPPEQAVYPPGFATEVRVGTLTEPLEGEHRGPEHFHAVTTVVTKLFNMVGPDVAYFGQKDAQQALVVRRLVRDLDLPVRVEVLPTVREPDGLAMSSRNARLGPGERGRAAALPAALRSAREAARHGERDSAALLRRARAVLDAEGVRPEYLELVSPSTLQPVERVNGAALLAVAARVGGTRLIDNVLLKDDVSRSEGRP